MKNLKGYGKMTEILNLPFTIDIELKSCDVKYGIINDFDILYMDDTIYKLGDNFVRLEFPAPIVLREFKNIIDDKDLLCSSHLKLLREVKDNDPSINDDTMMVMFQVTIL